MVKPSDITKCSGRNYHTWKPEAEALLMSEGIFDAVDPAIPIPGGVVQMRTWTANNSKAYGILYLTLDQAVQKKINNAGVQRSGRLLWAQLAAFYTQSDPATRSSLMSKLNGLTHDIHEPADTFLQAVIGIEKNLDDIAVTLPPFMIHDKIMNSLSSVYSPITTVLQHETTMRPVPDIISAINSWEQADLQKADSVVRAARLAAQSVPYQPGLNQGGDGLSEDVFAGAARHGTFRNHDHSSSHSHSHSSTNKFDWTNTKNRTDVCYRCGLPGHFAQFCVSIMPDDVRRRILRNREHAKAALTKESDDSGAETANLAFSTRDHFAAAVLDISEPIDIDNMDPDVREGLLTTMNTPNLQPVVITDSHTTYHTPVHPTFTATTAPSASSPETHQ